MWKEPSPTSGGAAPCSPVEWPSSERLQFAIHGAHPTGSVPRQKIAVIDDAFALCGGIDFTGDRWDTREPKHRSRFRRVPGRSYVPRHEIAAAVDGAAARAVGELARDRWRTATGQSLAPIDAAHVVWPRGLERSCTTLTS
jgi:phosphatidylserine/phosphatidylglycerophosphate/cardiolipin synthase-like enzyme